MVVPWKQVVGLERLNVARLRYLYLDYRIHILQTFLYE